MEDGTKKNDFVEIEFSAKIKDGKLFDTNIKSEAEKAGLDIKEIKPFILSIGHGMLIKGLDNELGGKEVGKKYSAEFKPEEAFGKRNPSLMNMVPLRVFTEQKIVPQRGMQLSLDNRLARVLSASGGRVLVDFNNPLAGKTVVYDFKINRKVGDKNERINALQDFFFKKRFQFELKQKTITFKVPEPFAKFIKLLAKPFEEILGMKLQTEIIKEEKKKEETDKSDANPRSDLHKEKKEEKKEKEEEK